MADSVIDAVLTFEEIAAILAAKDIDPSKLSPQEATEGQANSKWEEVLLLVGCC